MIQVNTRYPFRFLHPFSNAEIDGEAFVISTSPLTVRSYAPDPDLDRVLPNADQPTPLSVGVQPAVWSVLDTHRLFENFLDADMVSAPLNVLPGESKTIPIVKELASEDLDVVANHIEFAKPPDLGAGFAPADGFYRIEARLSTTLTGVGPSLIMLSIVLGENLDAGGELSTVEATMPYQVSLTNQPIGIGLTGIVRVGPNNRQVAVRVSHNSLGMVTFNIQSGGAVHAEFRSK